MAFRPQFNLYGPTPSAAAAQQYPWTAFYEQHFGNEAARADAAALTTARFQEAANARADARAEEMARLGLISRINATRYAQDRARENAIFRLERADKRADIAENLRRYNAAQTIDEKVRTEQKRQFDESLAERKSRLEPALTSAETLEQQIDFLNSETARAQARQEANAETMNARIRPGIALSDDERRAARRIDAARAEMIARSLADRIGRVPAQVRFDEDLGIWTKEPMVSRGFTPRIGGLREAESTMSLPETGSATMTPANVAMEYGKFAVNPFQYSMRKLLTPTRTRDQTSTATSPAVPEFATEEQARAAGHGTNDVVRLIGVGTVRLR